MNATQIFTLDLVSVKDLFKGPQTKIYLAKEKTESEESPSELLIVKEFDINSAPHSSKTVILQELEITRAIKQSRSTNLLGIREVYEDKILMDQCSNGDVFEILFATDTGLSETSVRVITASIVSQQVELAELGWNHCDLKPENIVLDHELKPLLIDFGQSKKFVNEDNCHHFQDGTASYNAPEILDGIRSRKPYNCQLSDMWSLGILIHLLRFRNPLFKYSNEKCSRFKDFRVNPSRQLKELNVVKGQSKNKFEQQEKTGLELMTSLLKLEPNQRLKILNLQNPTSKNQATDKYKRFREQLHITDSDYKAYKAELMNIKKKINSKKHI